MSQFLNISSNLSGIRSYPGGLRGQKIKISTNFNAKIPFHRTPKTDHPFQKNKLKNARFQPFPMQKVWAYNAWSELGTPVLKKRFGSGAIYSFFSQFFSKNRDRLPKNALGILPSGYERSAVYWAQRASQKIGTSMAYNNKIVGLCKNPQNVGVLDAKSDKVGTGLVGSPACGDVLKLQIQVDENGTIEDAKFKTFGCGSAIAASSLVTTWVKGKTLDQALAIRNVEISEHLALPPIKVHCSVLAESAIKSAVEDYKKKHIKEEA